MFAEDSYELFDFEECTLFSWRCTDCVLLSSGIIPPRIVFHLLQCHGSSASLLVCMMNAFPPAASTVQRSREKIPVSGFVSQHLVSSSPSLSLLIASLYSAHRNTFGSIFVSISCWITGAMQKTIWHDVVFEAGIALWCRSPLPALICSTLYSPLPDGRLKSIILPTEMCFPEHYIKPQSSVQGILLKKATIPSARWHCCPTKKSCLSIERLSVMLRLWTNGREKNNKVLGLSLRCKVKKKM